MQKVLVFDYYNGKLYDNIEELNEFLAGNHIILSYVVELDQDLAGQETNTTINSSL